MPNTGIKPEVNLVLASMVLNMLREDQTTASYVTGCLMHGVALKILHDVGRPRTEILESTMQTLDEYDALEKRIVQTTPS